MERRKDAIRDLFVTDEKEEESVVDG